MNALGTAVSDDHLEVERVGVAGQHDARRPVIFGADTVGGEAMEVSHALVKCRQGRLRRAALETAGRKLLVGVDPGAVDTEDGEFLVAMVGFKRTAAGDTKTGGREGGEDGILVKRPREYGMNDLFVGVTEAITPVGLADELTTELSKVVVESRVIIDADPSAELGEGGGAVG